MSNCTIQCPYCGNSVDAIMALEMQAGNEWTQLLHDLPISFIGALLRYLELFKPAKQELRWSRRLNLTKELMPMIKAAQVKRHGIAYAAPLPTWEAEMLRLSARPASVKFPLKNNAYLLAVLAAKGEQHAAQLERDIEHKRQFRSAAGADRCVPPENHAENLMAEAERKKKARETKDDSGPRKPPDGWRGVIPQKPP